MKTLILHLLIFNSTFNIIYNYNFKVYMNSFIKFIIFYFLYCLAIYIYIYIYIYILIF
ncbi:hypothetical protein U3516DRAFT_897650 [Neocallimastix sp. 'constans']